jgi:hypothetical protein
MSLLAFTLRPYFSTKYSILPKVSQRINRRIDLKDYAAAISSIPSIRPTLRHELLAPEADSPITAGPCSYPDNRAIDHIHIIGVVRSHTKTSRGEER